MAQINLGHVVGPGVPSGGTAGQVLKKNSATNYDASWVDPDTLPEVNAPVLDLAAAYNASTVYQEGDRCTKDGNFYKRKSWGADTPAAEAWTAAHWDQITVSSELDAEATARAAADTSTNQAISNYINDGVCKRLASGTALKSVTQNGRYYAVNAPDAPSGYSQSGYLDVFSFADGYRKIMYQPVDSVNIYVAKLYGGTWTDWELLALKNEFSPSSFSSVTVPDGSVVSGGYVKIGKLVVVQLRITTTSSTYTLVSGLPVPLNKLNGNLNGGVVKVSAGSIDVNVNGAGQIAGATSIAAGTYVLACAYICE